EGGSRSGLSGFSRTSVSLSYLYTFDEISKDFTTTNYIVPSGIDLYWAVWGYNKDWVLISATSQKIINFK
ncbi:MAG: hypothetical protein SVR08_13670, partial [Spirochaetota bacterium]|nr:hypothetical protein [Spirochaetota bacterium]